MPVAQPRARATGRGGHVRMYSPTTIKTATGKKPHPIVQFKHAVLAAFLAHGGRLIEGPVAVSWVAVFPRPKAMLAKKFCDGRIPHAKKPDRDNIDKAIMDALKGYAWRDDCQVSDGGRLVKRYAGRAESPHVTITIDEVVFYGGLPHALPEEFERDANPKKEA